MRVSMYAMARVWHQLEMSTSTDLVERKSGALLDGIMMKTSEMLVVQRAKYYRN